MDTTGRPRTTATRRQRAQVAVLTSLLAVPLSVLLAGSSSAAVTSRAEPAGLTGTVATGCEVVALGRAGRAWLPWAAVAVVGADTVRVADGGPARLERRGALVVVQRTARRHPAGQVPVVLEVVAASGAAGAVRRCEVDVGRAGIDPDHHVRRVATAD